MTRGYVVVLLAALLVLAGCGSHSIGPAPAGPASTGDLPPKWVQQDALWQALDSGDAHPQACQWALLSSTTLDEVGHLKLKTLARAFVLDPSDGPGYLVILRGHFRIDGVLPAKTIFLVLVAATHDYAGLGWGASRLTLSVVGHMHLFTPRMPYSGGVWGFAEVGGGPSGRISPIPEAPVGVWKGPHAAGKVFLRLTADRGGFFSLDLPPGTYTLALTHTSGGFPMGVTVTVAPGRVVSAGVRSDE